MELGWDLSKRKNIGLDEIIIHWRWKRARDIKNKIQLCFFHVKKKSNAVNLGLVQLASVPARDLGSHLLAGGRGARGKGGWTRSTGTSYWERKIITRAFIQISPWFIRTGPMSTDYWWPWWPYQHLPLTLGICHVGQEPAGHWDFGYLSLWLSRWTTIWQWWILPTEATAYITWLFPTLSWG